MVQIKKCVKSTEVHNAKKLVCIKIWRALQTRGTTDNV